MEEIREYILEAGRPIKKVYKKTVRRASHRKYKQKRAAILRKAKLYRRSTQGRKARTLYKRKMRRSSYRPVRRIYR
jgi:hypothetical protein